MYPSPFHRGNADILQARGFQYSSIERIVSNTHNSGSPLSLLSTLLFSTVKSGKSVTKDAMALGSTLTGPSLVDLKLPQHYFRRVEIVLYTCVLLPYASITPGLRIADLLSSTSDVYVQSLPAWTEPVRYLPESYNVSSSNSLRMINIDRFRAAVPRNLNQSQRFGHFIRLVNQTLSLGSLASTSLANLAITEGNAAVKSGDEIWILFGCPTPMVLRRDGSDLLVVSPAYIHEIMNGEAVEGVTTPDKHESGLEKLKSGRLGPRPEYSYVSGKNKRVVEMIRLR